MKPYCNSKKYSTPDWKQCGEKITYEKKPLRYKFIYE